MLQPYILRDGASALAPPELPDQLRLQGCSSPSSCGMEALLWLPQSRQPSTPRTSPSLLRPHLQHRHTPKGQLLLPDHQPTPHIGFRVVNSRCLDGWDSLLWHLCPCLIHLLWQEPTQSTAAMRCCVAPASTRFIFQIINFFKATNMGEHAPRQRQVGAKRSEQQALGQVHS